MYSPTANLQVTLRFVTQPTLELRATEFGLRTLAGPVVLKCSEGKAGDGCFEWREGTQALCICLLRYLCESPEVLAKGIKFVFEGAMESPAKTLLDAIGKANKANCWQVNMFGNDANGTCRLRGYIKRRAPDPKVQPRKYELEIQHEQFPQRSIAIELDGHPVIEHLDLTKLADKIEDLWYDSKPQYKAQWAKVKEARKQRNKALANKKKTATIEQVRNPEKSKNDGTNTVDETTELPDTHASKNSLAELFKPLPVTTIISHIAAAMLPARGNLAMEKFSEEILSPECVSVLAEKLVSESINSFNDFFCATFEPPWESLPRVPEELNPQKIKNLQFEGVRVPDIKTSVGVFIASNRDLRQRLAFMVARCGFYDMWYWFTAISFCRARESVREIVHEIESELNAAAVEPDFKERFLLYAPDRLPKLIQCFSHNSCVVAVRLFEKINEEGRGTDKNSKNYEDSSGEKSQNHRTKPHRK